MKKHLTGENKPGRISVKDEEGMLFLQQDEIIMLEKEQKQTLIHTKSKIYQTMSTLSSIEGKLNSNFLQIHRGFIVNLNKIHRIIPAGDRTNLIQFKNYDKEAYVSRRNIPELYSRLGLN